MPRRRRTEDDAQTPEEQVFWRFLHSRGLKSTQERRRILQALMHQETHVEAEGLYETLKDSGISRATVYRTLDLLVACGLVRKSALGTKGAVFEYAPGGEHHDHLVCVRCGGVEEFFSEDLEKLQDRLCAERSFKALKHNLAIFGHCKDCQDS